MKGYRLLYDRQNYKLFIRDTLHQEMKANNFTGGGTRVPYEEGYSRIMAYRDRLPDGDDTSTRYISFAFDSIFNYMGHVLTQYDPTMPNTDNLGMTVYVALNNTPLRRADGSEVYQRTILLGPTKNSMQWQPKQGENFDFFNQGSICPVMCPEDGDVKPPLTKKNQ